MSIYFIHRATAFIFLMIVRYAVIAQSPGAQLFDNTKIHEISILSSYESMQDSLVKNYVLSFGLGQIQTRKIPYEPALIIIDDIELDTIGIRHKGFNSWWNSEKKPIKIDINRYKDQKYDGLTKFNLHNGSGDPSFIRESISYNILRSMGIPAPRTAYAKVYINELYIGLYHLVEQIDNIFLDVHSGDHDGNLYVQQSKGSGGFVLDWISNKQEDYYSSLELENHQSANDWSGLIHFLDVLNNAPDATFKNDIQDVFDVNEYLQVLAFDIAINNIDWYGNSGRNYYLAEVNGKFHWLPWDYNLSWREDAPALNISPTDYPILINRILQEPQFYNRFLEKYCSIVPHFSSSTFDAMVDTEATLIKSLLENDPYLDYPHEAFLTNLETTWEGRIGLKEFAARRYSEMTTTLQDLNIDCSLVTDIPGVGDFSVTVFPNPADNFLQVEADGIVRELVIVNNLGQVVAHTTPKEDHLLDVHQLPAGVYTVKVFCEQKWLSKLIMVK